MQELKELLKAGVHFGHKTSKWSPKMAPFIWGAKNKIHLIDIAKTSILLNRSTTFLKKISSEGKQVLLVGTKKAAQSIIEKMGRDLDLPVVTNRWIGGTLSNYNQIKKAITKLLHLRDVVKKSTSYYTKKELSTLMKEIARLEKNVGGITNFKFPPAAIVVVDAKRERAAVSEALCSDIPVISMVDTNTDPTGINFIIPSNDDSPKAIKCIMDKLAATIAEGKKLYAEKTEKEAAAKKTVTKTEVPKKEVKAEVKKEKVEEKKVTAPKKETAPRVEEKKVAAIPKKEAPKKATATKATSTEKKEAKAAPKTAKAAPKKATTAKKAAPKTVAKKPAAKKPAVKKTTAKKIVAKKSEE